MSSQTIQRYEHIINKISWCISQEDLESAKNPDSRSNQNRLETILMSILNNKSLLEIAQEYNIQSNYNNNYLTQTSCGLFDAYIHYKNNKNFDLKGALYLRSRAGTLGTFKIQDGSGNSSMIFLSVREIIREIDGTNFFVWLNKLADEAEKKILLISYLVV